MKNYINEAYRRGIMITSSSKYLEKYFISDNYVVLRYMDHYSEIKKLSEVSKEELDERQREDLRQIEKKVKEKTSFDVKYYAIASGLYLATGTTLYAIRASGNPIWFIWEGYFLSRFLRPMCLRRDIKLAGWIHDNREAVNKVIREEVEKKMDKVESDMEAINLPIPEYPKDKVPYSEDMYEEGISLNNIEELSNRQLRKLKRKVIRRS